jgi:hypothetical protein
MAVPQQTQEHSQEWLCHDNPETHTQNRPFEAQGKHVGHPGKMKKQVPRYARDDTQVGGALDSHVAALGKGGTGAIACATCP